MKRVSYIWLLVVFLVGAGSAGLSTTSWAIPLGSPGIGMTTVAVGSSTAVTASWGPDEAGPARLEATVDIGEFIEASPSVNDVGVISGLGTHVLTIADDADANVDPTTTINAVFRCRQAGTTTFVLTHNLVVSAPSMVLTCVAQAAAPGQQEGATIGIIPGVGQVVATSNPNVLPCGGGTAVIKAEVVDTFGVVLAGWEFRFHTTAGTLVQTSPTTASLTLGPNQTAAVVSASIFDPTGQLSAVRATVPVNMICNGDDTDQTLVVTASPNVIQCSGTSILTATVRDRNGHVVPGRGFHFYTSAGLLEVDPNNASTEEGVARLTLRPGDGDATVAVSSGLLFGTYEEHDDVESNFVVDETGMVTVRQNCLSTTTGQIRVNSSAVNLHCGERAFIGLSVIDSAIQTVVDNTPLTLIASGGGNGGFFVGVGGGTNGVGGSSEIILPQVSVQTAHGEANAIYVAPTDYNGEVRITAASGDTYGFRTLKVSGCVTTGGVAPGVAPAPAPAPCVPIGDGICITPPNTGNRITPPSTGDAGLR